MNGGLSINDWIVQSCFDSRTLKRTLLTERINKPFRSVLANRLICFLIFRVFIVDGVGSQASVLIIEFGTYQGEVQSHKHVEPLSRATIDPSDLLSRLLYYIIFFNADIAYIFKDHHVLTTL